MRFRWVILFLILTSSLFAEKVDYFVNFIGIENKQVLKSLNSVSILILLQHRPPSSINALKYRADSDIPFLLNVLHAYGYYDATVNIQLEKQGLSVQLFVFIEPGVQYTLEEYEIDLYSQDPANKILCKEVSLTHLGLELGETAFAQKIVKAEGNLLSILADNGYPLASIKKREMVANGKTKGFYVQMEVDVGLFSRFGTTEIGGNSSIKPEFFYKKISWKESDVYDSALVQKTQNTLMDSFLFTSVLITHPENLNLKGELPLKIEVVENKHKSINTGISYQTFYGPGLTFGWENRNIGGLGRTFSLQADATKKTHSGAATLFVPDCFYKDQDFVSKAEAMYESIFTYFQKCYHFTNRVERRISTRYLVSGGFRVERIFVEKSVSNGIFSLLQIPLYFRWSSADDLLNPTEGFAFEYRAIPSFNFSTSHNFFFPQSFRFMFYTPLQKGKFCVLAQQIMLESIASQKLGTVPVPKRILGGTEQELRGYRYKTVSPLIGDQPIGGRSAIFYTLETRFRVSKRVGLVPFFDLGSVYLTSLPKLKSKWYQSTGLGIRYFSFLGPLRFDIAFPLNRRAGIDPQYRFLVSMGQTF